MKHHFFTAVVICITAATTIYLATPLIFAQRITPGTFVNSWDIGGVSQSDLPGLLRQYGQSIAGQTVTVRIKNTSHTYTLADLGVSVNIDATMQRIEEAGTFWFHLPQKQTITPVLVVDGKTARQHLHQDFLQSISLPQNASLTEKNSQFVLVPSAPGQQVDIISLANDITSRVSSHSTTPIDLVVVSAPAPIQDSEVGRAQELANHLLTDGFSTTFEDKQFVIKAFTVRRLIEFVEQVDPSDPSNTILGVRFKPDELRSYLNLTIAPEVNQEAINARFTIQNNEDGSPPRVEQFALPQRGQALNADATATHIAEALQRGENAAELAVDITDPELAASADIERLGITSLLATGESDFARSPANRVFNIKVGASRYQGLLIAPGEEFSFNKYLGPVNAEAGFKPELVIKSNVTVPEFGGGLCQVSTTAFRAALLSGLKVTERKSHSYAVSYYGAPGFDATIYPGYTDLRFLNNTPGYILIQTKVEGTKLIFEFWGTKDGREVAIDGPHQYDRQSNGAVKATLEQHVVKDGEVLIDDTFYSNYKSPKLFPHVLSANGENPSHESNSNQNSPAPTGNPPT